jgi:methylphosphotriester-DNA--protein-cysteine methyltransferase
MGRRLRQRSAANARIVRKLQLGEYWRSMRHKDSNATGAFSVGVTTRD